MLKPERFNKKERHFLAGEHIAETATLRPKVVETTTQEKINQSFFLVQEICGIPEKNQQHRIVTVKAIVTFQFILAVLGAEKIKDLYIAVYRIGKKTLAELIKLHEGRDIENIFLLINTGLPKLVPGVYEMMKAKESPNFRIRIEHTHTKIVLMKTDQGNHYVVEGSGNMSQNGQFEQYVFEENPQVYDFHKNWMEKY
jgi:hypothetical protein